MMETVRMMMMEIISTLKMMEGITIIGSIIITTEIFPEGMLVTVERGATTQ